MALSRQVFRDLPLFLRKIIVDKYQKIWYNESIQSIKRDNKMKTYEETIQILAQKHMESLMGGGSGQFESFEIVALIYGKKESTVQKAVEKAFAKL